MSESQRIFAPPDPEKWADVAEHIVRHYNDGWAEGFHFGIRYWEVWNEPDGLNPACEPNGCPNWIGTAEEYYRLYSLTANRIKRLHPEVKVGGYSSCYILGKFENGRWEAGDASYFTDFLRYISDEKTRASAPWTADETCTVAGGDIYATVMAMLSVDNG